MSLKLKLFVVFILAASAVQAGLGLWQWNRRAEKAAFVAAMEKAAAGPAVPYAGAALWSKVTLEGRFLHQHTAYVRTSRAIKGQTSFGVLVMTPLVTRVCGADGKCSLSNVYVNRGFLPTLPDGKIPPYERPEEPLKLTGFLRPGEPPSLFQPSNDPARRVWFGRDVAAMAKAAQLPGAEGSYDRFIDREAVPGEAAPLGIEPESFLKAIPDNHLTYAFTWWGLMLTNLVVLVFFLRRKGRQEEER
jgi:surfeit locus 1 family protein